MHSNARLRALAVLLALALGLTACGGDDEPAEEGTEDTDASEDAEAAEELEVTATDYAFDIPATVDAGTKLTLTNASEKEAHEMVLFRIPEGEERTLDELLALPEEEAQAAVQFQGVAMALPGEDTIYPQGDVVAKEAGRYAIVCFIPVGQDVEQLKAAMAAQEEGGAEGPPEMGDGPPHFTQGMKSEFTVS